MGIRKIVLVACSAVPALAFGAFLNLVSGFSIEREVTLAKPDIALPGQLIKASDGGYFVVSDSTRAWIDKTDMRGNLLWNYSDHGLNDEISHFASAEITSDGGVFICGWRESSESGVPITAGIVVRIDRNGHQTARFESPFDKAHQLHKWTRCASWGDGFAVIGDATIPDLSRDTHVKGVYVIGRLSADGALIWQKDLDLGDFGGRADYARTWANGDLLFEGSERIARLDASGHVLTTVNTDASCNFIESLPSSDSVRTICHPYEAKKMGVIELTPDLKITRRTPYQWSNMDRFGRAFAWTNDTIIVVGSTKTLFSRFIPTVFLYSMEGTLLDKYTLPSSERIGWIADGIPTGVPGEFVTIHQVDSKAVMTFLKHK